MKLKKTITLADPMSFTQALQRLMNGECLGIRPAGNTRYLVPHRPAWMRSTSDFLLAWTGSPDNEEPNLGVRATQYLEELWHLVIIDHRSIE